MCPGTSPGAEESGVQLSSQQSPSVPVYSTAAFGGDVTAAEAAAARDRHVRRDEVLCEGGQGGSSVFDPFL